MKKYIFSVIALAASLTGCTGDYTDWADPITNAQPETVSFGNGSVTEVGVIDFASVTSENVQVCQIVAPTASSADYSTTIYKLHLGDKTYDIASDGKLSASDLKTYVETNYGKAPVERDMDAYMEQWISNGTTAIKTATSGTFKIKAKLDAPVIYDHLYLIGGVQGGAWDPTSTVLPFTHSSNNVYDDPVFTITVPVSDGETWFAITDDYTVQSNDWSQVFGAREGNGMNNIGATGNMARRTDLSDDGSFKITVDGDAKYMKITCNMLEGTYLIEKINYGEYFYEIGGESGWSTNHALYGANADGKYQGYYYLDSEFKFKPNADNWDGDYEYAGEGMIADNGGSNCPAPSAGCYQIDVDLAAGTYVLTEVKSITVVGNHNGWNQADAACHMTYNKDAGCWEATLDLSKDGFKFAMNDDWAVSWGGANGDAAAYSNLTQNGGKDLNLPDGAGTYDIKLYISYEGANKVVLTKK